MHPYSSTDTTAAWRKLRFVLLDRSDFHMTDNLSIIFLIGLSVTFGDFSNRFLKCSFHKCIHSSCLAVLSLALEVLFFVFRSITVCHAIQDCLSSIEFLILLIWPWIPSVCSFMHALSSSLGAFLIFRALTLVGFFHYIGMPFSRWLVFS